MADDGDFTLIDGDYLCINIKEIEETNINIIHEYHKSSSNKVLYKTFHHRHYGGSGS